MAAQDGTNTIELKAKAVHGSGGFASLLKRYVDLNLLTSEETELISDLFNGILALSLRAHDKELAARDQLEAIRKFTYPEDYKLPQKVIKQVADKYEVKAYLAQGGRIREVMAELSWVVACVESGKNVLTGRVRLCEPEETNGTEDAYSLASNAFGRLRTETTTLQTLAINVLRHQDPAFKKKSVSSLKRALREVERWEASREALLRKSRQSWLDVDGGPPILIPNITDGWKRRKKGSGGDRKDKGRWEKEPL